MKHLIEKWADAFDDLKAHLYETGEKGDSLQYNLLSTEAMILAACIIDLQNAIIEQQESSNNFLKAIKQAGLSE